MYEKYENPDMIGTPCFFMRGGTSRGLYFLKKDLPEKQNDWAPMFLRFMGSPDTKQIDGVGGAVSVTSKIAVVGPSSRPDADVDYTFAQVSVDKPIVSYAGNCGNISSGVGPFAVETGLVPAKEGITTVRVYNTNTDKIIEEDVVTRGGRVIYSGDYAIAGVPGTAAPVKLKFMDPAGTLGGGLLPTGNPSDMLEIEGLGSIRVSIVDAANPLVFVKAEDAGLKGTELPKDLDNDPGMLERLEKIRSMAAFRLGLVSDPLRSAWDSPGIPKMTFVSAPQDYTASDGSVITGASVDICSRMMSMQKTHPSYAMTGAMCTAAAAVIPGTVVNEVLSERVLGEAEALDESSGLLSALIRIGHPSGILEAGVEFIPGGEGELPFVRDTYGFRTARLLMKGEVY